MNERRHELKTLPEFFQAVWVGDKTFEVRKNDRDFRERDEIILREWFDPLHTNETGYTGREVHGMIRYLTRYAQQQDYVVFAFEMTGRSEE